MRVLFSIAVILLFGGCSNAKKSGNYKFLLPWQSADGHYRLREVTLTTLSSPFELKGRAAEIYYEGTLTPDGYHSSVAHPRLTKSGDVYVPMDVPSALAVTVYANYEFLYEYEKKLGTRNELSWPRKVGVEIRFAGKDSQDNAHYFPTVDSTAFLPYDEQGAFDRIPLAVNSGVIAHEHFHAHFQHEVIDQLEKNYGTKVLDSPHPDVTQPISGNNLVMRGWNEGLADLFGAIYTGQPDFFIETLPTQADRRLDGPLRRFQDLNLFFDSVAGAMAAGKDPAGPSYQEGTTLARLMYAIANSGIESPIAFESRILHRLPAVGEAIAPMYASRFIQPDEIIPILLDGFPLNSYVCQSLEQTVSMETMERSFAKCADL